MTQIMLCNGDCGTYEIVNLDNESDTILIQVDWDYPSVASAFGWVNPCTCGSSDGTVDCKTCGLTAGDMIQSAMEYLDDNADYITAEDPGYFDVN